MAAVGLLLFLFGRDWLPARRVTVETVVAMRVAQAAPTTAPATGARATDPARAYAGAVRFQASGWFEAAPYAHRATALASGIVQTVHVLEGESVAAGDPIATLIAEDVELRVARELADLQAASASVDAAAQAHALASATEERIRRQIAVAEARREELADLADRATELGPEVVPPQDIRQSRLRLQTQERVVASLEAEATVQAFETARRESEILVRRAQQTEATARLGEAELELERMVVRAPIDGVVQRLLVAPGQKKMLMADNPESATVALVFDPAQLQARIDVPIADAAQLFVGQAVLLESEFLPGTELRGFVERIHGEADLQRNTLQAKVRIEDPPVGWRPDILCRARFLDSSVVANSPTATRGAVPSSSALIVLVPRAAVVQPAGAAPVTWAVDASGEHAERRSLVFGPGEHDGFLEVREGLRPGDRVVLNPPAGLGEGDRIVY